MKTILYFLKFFVHAVWMALTMSQNLIFILVGTILTIGVHVLSVGQFGVSPYSASQKRDSLILLWCQNFSTWKSHLSYIVFSPISSIQGITNFKPNSESKVSHVTSYWQLSFASPATQYLPTPTAALPGWLHVQECIVFIWLFHKCWLVRATTPHLLILICSFLTSAASLTILGMLDLFQELDIQQNHGSQPVLRR